MTQFIYKGVSYQFDSDHCYNRNDIIRLPCGTYLRVLGWMEVCPPVPAVVEPVEWKKEATPAFPC